MRKILFLSVIAGLSAGLFAQESDTANVEKGIKNIVTVTENNEGTTVNVSDDFAVDDKGDTIKVKLGKKGISVVETGEGTHVEITDIDNDDEGGNSGKEKKFKGHWVGYELGNNNIADRNFTLAGSIPETGYLDLNTGKSWNANINFIQYSLTMSQNIGMVTGLGFEWNNYYFGGNNVIGKDAATGRIIPLYLPAGVTYTKAKMNTTYMTVPLLLEFQFGHKHRGLISFGVIGGLKIHSNIQEQYTVGGLKEKLKTKDDLNLSPVRAAGTLRIGYGIVKLFANVGLVPLFEKNLGPAGAPELYPVTIGLILFSFN
jgi:hypothetical protein